MPHVLKITALACAAVLAAAAADNQLTAPEKAAGWRLMFDGKTFAGWEDPTKKVPPDNGFTIEDGCIKPLPHQTFNQDLFTQALYGDFEMEFDWKISPGGNSGVKYRIQDRVTLVDEKPGQKFEDRVNASMKNRRTDRPVKGQEYVIGFEYQVLDNAKNPDALRGTNHQAGALYDMLSPLKDATRPVGEFNHARLVVKGDAVEHWLRAGERIRRCTSCSSSIPGTPARSPYRITAAMRGSRILRYGSCRGERVLPATRPGDLRRTRGGLSARVWHVRVPGLSRSTR